MAHPDFGRSVNPISTRSDYAHLITTGTPGFSDLTAREQGQTVQIEANFEIVQLMNWADNCHINWFKIAFICNLMLFCNGFWFYSILILGTTIHAWLAMTANEAKRCKSRPITPFWGCHMWMGRMILEIIRAHHTIWGRMWWQFIF